MAIVLLFLVLLYSVVVAGDISLTTINNVDGTLTVGYTYSGGGRVASGRDWLKAARL